jgi:hypothetical protein
VLLIDTTREYRFSSSTAIRSVDDMTTSTSRNSLDALAWAVAEDGVERHLDAVRALAHEALAAGASPVLVSALLDSGQPAVARQRAFAAVAAVVAEAETAAPPSHIAAA